MRDTTNEDTEPSQIIEPDPPAEEPVEDLESPGPGRHTLFNPEFSYLAMVMCEQGFRTLDLARAFKVDQKTITNWKRRYPDFKDAVVAGQDHFNVQQAESALVKRVTGYDYKEETHELKVIGRKIIDIVSGEQISEDEFASRLLAASKKTDVRETLRFEDVRGMILTKRMRKHVAPSERALEYFLNNRARFDLDEQGRPRWTHHNKMEITGADGAPLIPENEFNPEKFLAELLTAQKGQDDIVEAEIVEAKQLGVETGDEAHDEARVPDTQ